MKKNMKKIIMFLLLMLPSMNVYAEENMLTCNDISHVTQVYTSLRIIAPFLLIIFGSIDFFKAITAGDQKKQQEARSKFPKRVIAFLLLIIVPFFVHFIVTTFGRINVENTSLFCCVVTNGSDKCEGFNYNSNSESGDWSKPGDGSTSNDAFNKTSQLTSDNLCNGSNYEASDFLKTETIEKMISIQSCIEDYHGTFTSWNLSNQTCKCSYTYIVDLPDNLCNMSNCSIGKRNNKCIYNVEKVATLENKSSSFSVIKEVKTSSGWDVYYNYDEKAEANVSASYCEEHYNGTCYGEDSNNCTCVYKKQ